MPPIVGNSSSTYVKIMQNRSKALIFLKDTGSIGRANDMEEIICHGETVALHSFDTERN